MEERRSRIAQSLRLKKAHQLASAKMKAARVSTNGGLKKTRTTSKLKQTNEVADNVSTHLELLEKLAAQRGIQKLEDWYSVKESELPLEYDRLLIKQFNGSLYNALKTAYPSHDWKPWKFERVPRGFWTDQNNQKRFFDDLKTTLNITKPQDWYQVKLTTIFEHGGRGLISSFYKNSVFNALHTLYPNEPLVPWLFEKAPSKIWQDKENHKKYFDWLSEQLHIKTWPDDWYKIRQIDITPFGASSVLSHYNGSISQALGSIYPQYEWKGWLFQKTPPKYLADEDNMRKFVMELAQKLSITTLEDWYRISHIQLRQIGAANLASTSKLYRALSVVYPDHSWDLSKFKERNKTSAQRWLSVVVGQLFPSEEIIENYTHPNLLFVGTKREMRLDVFVPALSLAFEFNGPQHYKDIQYFGPHKQYSERDEEKKKTCKQRGITVVDVPYWWNGSVKSLAATVKKMKPDVKMAIEISETEEAIPQNAPKRGAVAQVERI